MLQDQINKDYVQAMKDRDQHKSSTLNFLRAQLKNVIIERRIEKLTDEDVIVVIKKQIKQRQDSIEQFRAGGRLELVEKEERELSILKSYLPQELSAEKIKEVISAVIRETKASSVKDMGMVMKEVLVRVSGQADNKIVSQLVKEALSGA